MQHLCLFMYYSSKKGPNKVGPLSSVPPLTANLGEGAHLIRFSLHRISRPGNFEGFSRFQVAASSLEEEVAMLRAEAPFFAEGGCRQQRIPPAFRSLGMCGRFFACDFLQCGYRIAQSSLVVLQCINTPLWR